MKTIFCNFCHEYIDADVFSEHQAQHLQPRPDGQQSDYATLPESERESSDLSGVPRVYVHQKCGVATKMPEQIIRTYLKDPFFYSDFSYCCGCKEHVPASECVWLETGENRQAYTDRLRKEKQRADAASLDSLMADEDSLTAEEFNPPITSNSKSKPTGCLFSFLFIGAILVWNVFHFLKA